MSLQDSKEICEVVTYLNPLHHANFLGNLMFWTYWEFNPPSNCCTGCGCTEFFPTSDHVDTALPREAALHGTSLMQEISRLREAGWRTMYRLQRPGSLLIIAAWPLEICDVFLDVFINHILRALSSAPESHEHSAAILSSSSAREGTSPLCCLQARTASMLS